MPSEFEVRSFIQMLERRATPGAVFNPWREGCSLDVPGCGAAGRRERLARFLAGTPSLLLIGEATAFHGARYTGIPFTSERLLLDHGVPRVRLRTRITKGFRPLTEPPTTIAWRTFRELMLAEEVVTWNVYPFHAFNPALPAEAVSNRAPSADEKRDQAEVLEAFLALFPGVPIGAIGTGAQHDLERAAPERRRFALRHPASGGAEQFRMGCEAAARALGIGCAPPMLFDLGAVPR
jgi:hypothetical protein